MNFSYLLTMAIVLLPHISFQAQSTTSDIANFTAFPQYLQLIPRNPSTNMGTIKISGAISNSDADGVLVELYRDGVVINTFEKLNNTGSLDSTNFDFEIPIVAEKKDYDVKCYAIKDSGNQELKSANRIVAGDAYIITGQSNAEGGVVMADEDFDEFLRGFKSDNTWSDLKFAKPGKWGGRIAKRILDETNIPVCIMNKAVGAKPAEYFVPSYAEESPNNFEVMQKSIQDAGLEGKIRAGFWFQGEADGWEASIDGYKSDFMQLANGWLDILKVEHVYLYQLRFQSCTHPKPFVLEAQRQAAIEHDFVDIMSTSNAAHDGCHFDYLNGYQSLGDRMFNLVNHRFYQGDNQDIAAPDIQHAYRSGDNKIVIEIDHLDGDLLQSGFPWTDFIIDSTSITVIGGAVDGKKLILELSETPPAGDLFVSYLCHPGPSEHWIYNQSGVGLLSFYHQRVLDAMPTSTEFLSLDNLFKIYPNPTQDILNIDLHSSEYASFDQVSIVDLHGRSLRVEQLNTMSDKFTIDVSEIPNGIYFLSANSEQTTILRKFIISR